MVNDVVDGVFEHLEVMALFEMYSAFPGLLQGIYNLSGPRRLPAIAPVSLFSLGNIKNPRTDPTNRYCI